MDPKLPMFSGSTPVCSGAGGSLQAGISALCPQPVLLTLFMRSPRLCC